MKRLALSVIRRLAKAERRKLPLYIIMVGCVLLASCDIVSSDNGELDGLWQLRKVENLRTGQTTDGRDKNVQWAFQGSLLQMRAVTDTIFSDVFCSFRHVADTLVVYAPHFSGRFIDGVNDDVAVTDAQWLNVYGLFRLEEHFKVLELNSDNMRLQSDSVRLYFRKY